MLVVHQPAFLVVATVAVVAAAVVFRICWKPTRERQVSVFFILSFFMVTALMNLSLAVDAPVHISLRSDMLFGTAFVLGVMVIVRVLLDYRRAKITAERSE